MFAFPLLSIVTFAPLVGALIILLFVRGDDADAQKNVRWGALFATTGTFLLSLIIWGRFEYGTAELQMVEEVEWIGTGIDYRMGIDGISLPLVLLTTFLMPLCILASWEAIKVRVKEYMIAFLLMETLMIGVFCAQDLLLFYLFFEAGLIPMFLIIGIWGGGRRIYASFKFFLYTLLGSVLMLLASLWIMKFCCSMFSSSHCLAQCNSPELWPSRRRMIPTRSTFNSISPCDAQSFSRSPVSPMCPCLNCRR